MQSVIRIGSRKSKLAVIQAEIVKKRILQFHPELEIEIVTMKTTGDKILHQSLEKIGGKGLFVKELDHALMEGRIDLAVHSLKDMPSEISKELPVFAFPKRGDPRDVLVYSEQAVQTGRLQIIGTGSRRRQIQMAERFGDCRFEEYGETSGPAWRSWRRSHTMLLYWRQQDFNGWGWSRGSEDISMWRK